ncbi:hypothetical protein WICPIJ_002600 [Wickerhamomyces pijperi]|uniref:Uncharacterized protein n=1 Tax=Wickerhamomyces pijperi TaxID=599730 RepID=A0A9P8TQ08_WICPI|nr:hypothetical protein WICPIJ_002600 [Wickerhamomyces pijperi]
MNKTEIKTKRVPKTPAFKPAEAAAAPSNSETTTALEEELEAEETTDKSGNKVEVEETFLVMVESTSAVVVVPETADKTVVPVALEEAVATAEEETGVVEVTLEEEEEEEAASDSVVNGHCDWDIRASIVGTRGDGEDSGGNVRNNSVGSDLSSSGRRRSSCGSSGRRRRSNILDNRGRSNIVCVGDGDGGFKRSGGGFSSLFESLVNEDLGNSNVFSGFFGDFTLRTELQDLTFLDLLREDTSDFSTRCGREWESAANETSTEDHGPKEPEISKSRAMSPDFKLAVSAPNDNGAAELVVVAAAVEVEEVEVAVSPEVEVEVEVEEVEVVVTV